MSSPDFIGHLDLADRVVIFQDDAGEIVFQVYLPADYNPESDGGEWVMEQFVAWTNEQEA